MTRPATVSGAPAASASSSTSSSTSAAPPLSGDPVEGPSRTGADLPAPPPDVVAAARAVPDHWITVVDPGWTDAETPAPAWALVGAWRTDSAGEIVEWRDNAEHRASPAALGWPAPTDQLDLVLQRVVTGYAPAALLLGVLAASDVLVLVGADGAAVAVTADDGRPAVPVYTSAAQAQAAGPFATRTLPVRELVDEVAPGHRLLLNPSAPAAMLLDLEPLQDRIAGR